MPIVINELVFKGSIGGGVSQENRGSASRESAHEERKAIIEACVEEVMRVLERQKER
jgi:Family of unknown function (DUF5908)